MEVVLLWLDDLDDLLFSAVLVWERCRTIVLQVGLVASWGVVGVELSAFATPWAPALAIVAAASVSTWLLGAAFHALLYRDTRGSPLSTA
jgi:hypothetical protein